MGRRTAAGHSDPPDRPLTVEREGGVLGFLAGHVGVLVAEDLGVGGFAGFEVADHGVVPKHAARLGGQVEAGVLAGLPRAEGCSGRVHIDRHGPEHADDHGLDHRLATGG